MTVTPEILFDVQHHIGMILLNRPQALNALSFGMFKALYSQLKTWQLDDSIHAVVIQAVPGRAFCAGGDVRWVYETGRSNPLTALALFHLEYRLNYLIATLGKPYIALMDGLTMGGGVGITLHGSHAVASEQFIFSMPEVNIGLFPDIGASYLLSACPDGYGIYLGLTGQRVHAADAQSLGLIKYTIPKHSFSSVIEMLTQLSLKEDAYDKVSECLAQYQTAMVAGGLMKQKKLVTHHFENKQTVSDIFSSLHEDNTPWAHETKSKMLDKAPFSLHVTLEQLNRAKGLTLAECLEMDYGLVYHFLKNPDFYEGVRARLIDKDQTPHWHVASWDEVSSMQIAKYFEKPIEISPLWYTATN